MHLKGLLFVPLSTMLLLLLLWLTLLLSRESGDNGARVHAHFARRQQQPLLAGSRHCT